MATRLSIDRQIRVLHRASDQALKELNKLLVSPEIRGLPDEALKEALKLYAPSLVRKYGSLAAAAASEWYMELRNQAGVVTDFTPSIARLVGVAAIKKGIDKLFEVKGEKLENRIRAQISQWVRQQAQETIVANALRDPANPKFARVPKGKTCAWCTMLASRGFVYASPETAGELKKFHSDCDCMIVPAWGSAVPKISGYDPARLRELYKAAWQKYATSQEVAARMRQQHPECYTDGKWPKLPTGKSSDGTLSLKEYEKYRRELKKLRYALGKDDDPRFLIPPPKPATAPKDWPKHLPLLDDKVWNHILYGDVEVSKVDGGQKFRGGHKSGYGWAAESSEFPPEWSEEKIEQSLIFTLSGVELHPARNFVSKEFEGTLVSIQIWQRKNGVAKIATAFPAKR